MRRSSPGPWIVVAAVGVLIVGLVFGLGLFKRLNAGQDVLDQVSPAFTVDRAAGARGGINAVSNIVDFAEPVINDDAKAVAEIPALLTLVSKKTGLSQAQVLAALGKRYPHTAALLQAVPLSSVNAEVPKLIAFLATTLKVSQTDVKALLAKEFPAINQAVGALPAVVGGWDQVPGTAKAGFTRFDGSPVRSVPDVRDYFGADLIPVVEHQQKNMTALAGNAGVGGLPGLLLLLGLAVIVFGTAMAIAARRDALTPFAERTGWRTVVVVGASVVVLVFAINLFGRLSGGDELLGEARPAFTEQRIAGTAAGIKIVSSAADLTQPIVDAEGGAAAEVPELVGFVAKQTGLSAPKVLALLKENFPHTTALLQALPLSDVTEEIPGVQRFLASSLDITEQQLSDTLTTDLPGLAQVLTALPKVTDGYQAVPGTERLTRFDGSKARTVPEVRDYFQADVIPALAAEQQNFQDLDDPWPPVTVFAPLLLVVGLLVAAFGLLMLARQRGAEVSSDYSKMRGAKSTA